MDGARGILPGLEWATAIIEAINACRVVVLVFTSHSNASQQVCREIERAVHKSKPIIPIRFEDIAPSDSLEYFISASHWLDMFPPPLQEKLYTLAASISILLGLSPDGAKISVQPTAIDYKHADSGRLGSFGRYRDFDLRISKILESMPIVQREKCIRLFQYYIGTAKHPVPFGGRAALIERCNAWLQDPDELERLLLTAPAGRGKTSLLVQWLRHLPEDWKIVFAPISIRFEMSSAITFYELLAHQLARLTGEALGPQVAASDEYYCNRAVEIMSSASAGSTKYVIVIDGLDEANGWQISSTLLSCSSPTFRFVVSARWLASDLNGPDDWAQRTDWAHSGSPYTSLVPQPLDQQGIAEALVSMGNPVASLGYREEMLDELTRLTSGDPLLVRMYADRLWERRPDVERLKPTELRELDVGYRGFQTLVSKASRLVGGW